MFKAFCITFAILMGGYAVSQEMDEDSPIPLRVAPSEKATIVMMVMSPIGSRMQGLTIHVAPRPGYHVLLCFAVLQDRATECFFQDDDTGAVALHKVETDLESL